MTIRKSSYANALVISLVLLTALPLVGNAQAGLEFSRIVNNWPTIEVYFKMACNGEPFYAVDQGNIIVSEDGVEIPDKTLWCPDPLHNRYFTSMAFVIDASTNMSGSSGDSAKSIARTFLSRLTDTTDEAAAIVFNDSAHIVLQMSQNMGLVQSAIENTGASGSAAVWDGVYLGLTELVRTSNNTVRFALLLSNGHDDTSVHTLAEVVEYANQHRIRVFVLSPDSTDDILLDSLALRTAGRFLQSPSHAQVLALNRELTYADYGFLECLIMYQVPDSCKDGSVQLVNLELRNTCGDTTVSRMRAYRRPFDRATTDTLQIAINKTTLGTLGEQRIPVLFNVSGTIVLPPCTVSFGLPSATFDSVYFDTQGTALENTSVSAVTKDGYLTLHILEDVTLVDSGVLFYISGILKTDLEQKYRSITVGEWISERPVCLYVTTRNGQLIIEPTNVHGSLFPLARTFTISPNPTSGSFDVALGFEQPTAFGMRVVNALGQVVYQRAAGEKGLSHTEQVRLPKGQPGLYFVIVESDGKATARKLVVW